MPDILGQGEDRPPRRWPRGLAVVAAAALVTVVIVAHLPRDRPGATPPRPQPSARGRAPLAAPAAVAAPGAGSGPSGVTGRTLPWDASLRLPVGGARPVWLWPSTGRTQRIGGLPPDGSGYQFTRVGGGWAVQAGARPGCGDCAGPPRPVYFLGDRAAVATPVGLATDVAPGPAAGTLWLTSFPPAANLAATAAAAQEVTVAGRPAGPQLRLPAGYVIDQATDHGLLLAPAAQQPGPATYRLWNPGGPPPGRPFAGVVAAGVNEIAWAARCAPACRVQVLDLATGRQTTVALPGVSSAADGAFSPDGAFLALEVSFYNGGDDGQLATQLDVASAASGQLTVVPGTWMSSDALAGFGWPAASDTLIAELSFTTKVQVASWRPGAPRLAVAAIRPGRNSASLIVG